MLRDFLPEERVEVVDLEWLLLPVRPRFLLDNLCTVHHELPVEVYNFVVEPFVWCQAGHVLVLDLKSTTLGNDTAHGKQVVDNGVILWWQRCRQPWCAQATFDVLVTLALRS